MEYLIKKINNTNLEQIIKIKMYKRKKIKKILKIDDKKRCLQGELLLIQGLKKHNIDYNRIKIKKNSYGKPYIQNNPLYYSISHSHDYVVCAFSKNKIGIDIEKIRDVDIQIMNQFATPNEKKYILKSKKQLFNRFFTIYTLKEAYFKMLGKNLNNMLNIEFTINKNYISCSDFKVKVYIIKTVNNYIISICEQV